MTVCDINKEICIAQIYYILNPGLTYFKYATCKVKLKIISYADKIMCKIQKKKENSLEIMIGTKTNFHIMNF